MAEARPDAGGGTTAGTEPDAEALRALEDRLERATAAAERLLAQAAAQPTPRPDEGGRPPIEDEVPPAGWQWRTVGDDLPPHGRWIGAQDAERLLAVLGSVLDHVPLELQQRLVSALRELLLALRALIDWCLERAERRHAAPAEVQDIPIL